jgi:transcriptional regulator of heat shock response
MDEIEKIEKTLTEAEICKIEITQLEIKLLESSIMELKKDILVGELQKQINSLKNELLTKNVADIKRKISEKQSEISSKKEDIKGNNKELAKKYKIEGAWGYNPETGTIIEED